MSAALNKREGERAGIESSLLLLQEEVSIVKLENDEIATKALQDSRKFKELQRETEALRSSLKIEREEMENLLIKNKVLSCAESRSSTPLKTSSRMLSRHVITFLHYICIDFSSYF